MLLIYNKDACAYLHSGDVLDSWRIGALEFKTVSEAMAHLKKYLEFNIQEDPRDYEIIYGWRNEEKWQNEFKNILRRVQHY